jgi:hypothetical protein
VDETKPFELSFKVNGTELKFVGVEVDSIGSETVFVLAPVGIPDDDGTCDVCRQDATNYSLIDGALRSRCEVHKGRLSILLGPLRLPKPPPPPTLDELLRSTTQEVDERKKIHDMMVSMKESGLSYPEVSRKLKSLGYEQVQPRTVQKHVLGECNCYPEQHTQ